ncbi:type VI secretion system tip protein VgrG [Motiliproteus coralliicola]|uniref:type VI secretion system tip protein VgrG n=1 Tax=Motiliproteus coralliicola TaxID=2283196 RepID=UPI001402945C|nr:type VI secretion system tip protein VgrG [Motiliproteus coralliicola]
MTNLRRTLPVSLLHREFSIKVNGELVPRSHHLLSASIAAPANKIASARLVYQDGAAATGEFPLLDGNRFETGSTVEILAGPAGAQELLFSGLVVAQKIRLRESASPQLQISCKHAAIKSTLTRNGRYFEEQSDSDVIQTLLSEYGFEFDVQFTTVTHKQLVQYDCSDWEFCRQRAKANGQLLLTRGERLSIQAPDPSGDPVCNLEFGATLLSADLETDARHQRSDHSALFWNSAEQTLERFQGQNQGQSQAEATPGNSDPARLADSLGAPVSLLRQATELGEESQQWADAQRQFAEHSRVQGTLKSQGIGSVQPGDRVTLSGLGAAFNGNALVTGVRHELDLASGWRSYFQVGGLDQLNSPTTSQQGRSTPLPPMSGLQFGLVVSNEDPEGEFRVKVRLPLLDNESDGIWARVASIDAGDDRGLMIRPELDDEVIVGFVQDDPRKAVILGMLHSSAHPAPEPPSDDNPIKLLKSRSGLQIRLDDESSELTLETPNGNQLLLTDTDSGLVLEDENSNKLVLNGDGIALQSAGDISLSAAGDIKLEASANLELSANANLKADGSAGIDINSSAITTVKGSLVKIN